MESTEFLGQQGPHPECPPDQQQAVARVASWLNQIEIYFSILQRKALTPNDFASLAAVEDRLLSFQQHYESIARPFEWKFTRRDLTNLLHKIKRQPHNSTPLASLARRCVRVYGQRGGVRSRQPHC